MNRPNPFTSTLFKPASQYLSRAFNPPGDKHRKSLSLDSADSDPDMENNLLHLPDPDGRLSRKDRQGAGESTSKLIPLVDISRSPSPYARAKSAAQSEDEEEYDYGDTPQDQPLVSKNIGAGSSKNKAVIFKRGGLGQFLFGTNVGWQIYTALLVFWVGGCQFGLLLMNRFILWTGTYKFPYPVTTTLIQLTMAHVLILGFASLTRGLEYPLNLLGLGAVIAPSHAYTRGNHPSRYRGGQRNRTVLTNIKDWLIHGSGGIAGGGIFEFQTKTAKHVLPLAVVYTASVLLSKLSYAYAVLPMYMLARIGVIPFTLIFTTVFSNQPHSIATLSSTLVATLNLLMATILPNRVTWESIVAGVFSSFFVALYPIVLLRAYRQLVSDLVPQGDLLTVDLDASTGVLGTKEETRAYWRILHYTSLMSIMILLPTAVLSGEIWQIRRNCYFLDVPWFWFLMVCGSLGTWAVFSSFLLLVKATNPLSAQFVSVPRSVFQLAVLSKFRLPSHSWIGASICVASCLWYVLVRRREDWSRRRSRLEGRI